MEARLRPRAYNPKAGATVIGAREFLIAYNVNLATGDKSYADDIAYILRERGRTSVAGNVSPFYYMGDVLTYERGGALPCGACDSGRVARTRSRHITARRTAEALSRRYDIDSRTALVGQPVYQTAASDTSRRSVG